MSDEDMNKQDPPLDNLTDNWLSDSLKKLPQVEVPSNFLPNVMFKVYEKHSRNLISWPKFAAFAGLLLILSIGFFLWEVSDHMQASQALSFGEAFSQRMDGALSGSQQIMGDLGGLFTAAWQITLSALSAFFTQTSVLLQATVFIGLIVLVILLKKGWSRLA